MKTIKEVTCPICEGEGFTIEIEADCCGNFIEPFECCMVPDAIQVQKECSCNNGLILIEE